MIQFLWAMNVSASDIHSQIVEVYGEESISRQLVAKRCHSFQSGRQDVENRNMAGNAWPSSSLHVTSSRVFSLTCPLGSLGQN
ncbi:hypothetical protein TNCV_4805451 [Trichonephila clavipes]|nr:hypothetical protein TNCV_4805451 [Trichonephila clavipes]